MVSGSRNPLRPLLIILANFVMAAIMNSKMAANKTSVLAYLGPQVTKKHDFDGCTYVCKLT
jgi:hypothetical protein